MGARGERAAELLLHWVRWCARSSEFSSQDASVLDPKRPTVLVLFHDELFLVPMLAYHWPPAERPVFVANDTLVGLASAGAVERMGAKCVVLPLRAPREEKLQKLRDAFAASKRILLAADYGEPWYRVRPTAWQLARPIGGVVAPLHIHAMRAPTLARRDHRAVLLSPFNRYRVSVGEALEAGDDATAFARKLEERLWALR
jgi:lysophospholipid acyltransferase (LPLAT)-like uncharacterized protein